MILELAIANFRSFDDEQVLSFYARGSQGGMLGNSVVLDNTPYRMLKSIGLYGANASGKTNVLKALWALRKIISASYGLGEGEKIPWYDPCVFGGERCHDVTSFEIDLTIPVEGVERRFLYKVAFNEREITTESLYVYAKSRSALLFSRVKSGDRNKMTFGASLRGGERKMAFFRNQAYLSVAGRHAGAPIVLRQVYQYFNTRITQIRLHEDVMGLSTDPNIEASRLVRFVDVGVMSVEKRVLEDAAVHLAFPSDMPERLRQRIVNRIKNKFVLTHEARPREYGEIDLDEESDGTQRMFWMFPQVVDTLINGGIFLIDEIECGMHPFLAEALVRLFNDPESNPGKAQLLFTTHNSNLMSPDLLRRDQIWFTEKKCGRTHCYSLDEFDKKMVTPTSPYVKWYLEGRFGAVPSIDFASLVKSVVSMRKDLGNAQ